MSVDPTYSSKLPGFDSIDSQVVISDERGNKTVRPSRPLLRQLGLVERQRLENAQKAGQRPSTSDA